MRSKLTLALVVGLLVGTGSATPTEPAAKNQKAVEKTTVEIPENATITIAPGTKIRIRPVKTEQGRKIRLETPSVTIEAVRLRVRAEGKITELQIGAGGGVEARRFEEENR